MSAARGQKSSAGTKGKSNSNNEHKHTPEANSKAKPSRHSLSQLLRLRDAKRERLSRLFQEKKTIIERMNATNDELIELDDEIETLEEARDQRRLSRTATASSPSTLQVKSEPNNDTTTNTNDINDSCLTMNPDEVLTEPTQQCYSQTPTQDRCDNSEQLTDPLTWTQAENTGTPPLPSAAAAAATTITASSASTTSTSNTFPQHKQQQHQQQQNKDDDDIDDYYYDSTEDRYVDENEYSVNDNNNNINDHSNYNYNASAAFPPLQFEAGSEPKPVAAVSNQQRKSSIGTLDSFLIPSSRNNNNNNNNNKKEATSSLSCPYSEHDIYQTLRQSFRLQTFRENQFEIIQSTLSGKDSFVLMKTGGGKSLLYQLPAVLESPKVTVVVSPLLSLIQDQEDQMNTFLRNSCVSFTSGMGTGQHTENWNRVRDVAGGVVMILVTPERVFKSGKLKSELQNLDEQNRLGRFVIDECHCACQWGHDFRPDYAKLQVLRISFPHIPILAVTATASEDVRKGCANIFQLSRDHAFFRSTANRPNLTYQVRPKESNVIEDMVDFIKTKHPRSAGIVYTYSRKDADTVAFDLCEHGIVAESYHSDVTPIRKRTIHQSWMANRTQVVVATIAFGLGINKPDVRFVFHHTLSKTLESYYQESGRAGRDGNLSDCVLYYSPKDVPRMLKMIHGDSTEDLFLTMVKYAQQFGDDQRCRALILRQMGEPNQNLEQCRGISEMVEIRNVTSHAITLIRLLRHLHNKKVTMNMLITEWRKGPSTALECVKNNPPGKELTKEDCERVVVALLMSTLLEPVYRFTAYSTVVYLQCTEKAMQFMASDKACMRLPLPKPVNKKRKSNASTPAKNEDGWIDTNASKRKRVSTASKSSSKKKAPPKKTSSKKTTAKKTTSKKTAAKKKTKSKGGGATRGAKPKAKKSVKGKENEVIELIEDSDDSEPSELEFVTSTEKVRPRRASAASFSSAAAASKSTGSNESWDADHDDDYNDDSVSEFEFE